MLTNAVFNAYDPYAGYTDYDVSAAGRRYSETQGAVTVRLAAGQQSSTADGTVRKIDDASELDENHKVKKGYQSSPADCKTCRERKYQDGSDESDVSFKAPGHISPQASASAVMAHERQHVSNAYQEAAEKEGDVVSCSVSLRTAVCPECGTVYVSGGTTSTSISYPDEKNPYQKDKKAQDAIRYTGANIDCAA